jgi:hypothetical protein
LQHIIHERSNIPKLRGDSEGDDFMKDITASNAIGAKPKGALELIAFRLQGLHQKSQKEKANP